MRKAAVILFCLALALTGCRRSTPSSAVSSTENDSKPWWDTETGEETKETIRGLIELRAWAKSAESWEAGGSDYHVVVLDDGSSTIVRPSDDVEIEQFTSLEGKRVELVGCRLKPAPWKPDPQEPHPRGVTTRGGGFKVKSIKALN